MFSFYMLDIHKRAYIQKLQKKYRRAQNSMIGPLFVVLTAYIDDEYLCRLLFSVLMWYCMRTESAQLNDTLESHRKLGNPATR